MGIFSVCREGASKASNASYLSSTLSKYSRVPIKTRALLPKSHTVAGVYFFMLFIEDIHSESHFICRTVDLGNFELGGLISNVLNIIFHLRVVPFLIKISGLQAIITIFYTLG